MESTSTPTAVIRSDVRVVFSHGKESGPKGKKIRALTAVAEELGLEVASIDYSDIGSPEIRVERLCAYLTANPGPVILVGSSMGGYVSLVAAGYFAAQVKGLFLLAPALYMGGDYKINTFPALLSHTVIVHGWRDEVVLFEHSMRYAQDHRADLILLNDDHPLSGRLETISCVFRNFLGRCIPRD